MSVSRQEKVGMMMYHVDVSRIGPMEMNRFIRRKYCNGYGISLNEIGQTIMQCQLALENGDAVWICPPIFRSQNESIEAYIERVDKGIQKLKEANVFDAVVGFHWDEPILNKQTNEDFYAMTKALYEKYGLRIFPVFSTYEIAGTKGNDEDILGVIRFEKWASEYITDIGFDSYGQDPRPEAAPLMQKLIKERLHDRLGYTDVVDGESYYRVYLQKLKDLMMGEPNIWFYPCAYICGTWTGEKTDEDYCIAHLEFFLKLLKEQEHPGGLHVYNWKTWYDYRPALDYFLDEECPERWDRYEKVLQRVCEEVNQMKLNPAKK